MWPAHYPYVPPRISDYSLKKVFYWISWKQRAGKSRDSTKHKNFILICSSYTMEMGNGQQTRAILYSLRELINPINA
jgi:hypothetical protein